MAAGLSARAQAGNSSPPSAVGSWSRTTTRLETLFLSAMGTMVEIHSGGVLAVVSGDVGVSAFEVIEGGCEGGAPAFVKMGGLEKSTDCQPAGVLRSLAS